MVEKFGHAVEVITAFSELCASAVGVCFCIIVSLLAMAVLFGVLCLVVLGIRDFLSEDDADE